MRPAPQIEVRKGCLGGWAAYVVFPGDDEALGTERGPYYGFTERRAVRKAERAKRWALRLREPRRVVRS